MLRREVFGVGTRNCAGSAFSMVHRGNEIHQGYEARGPKDIKLETFGVWLPDNEGLEIKNDPELVDRRNPDIHL